MALGHLLLPYQSSISKSTIDLSVAASIPLLSALSLSVEHICRYPSLRSALRPSPFGRAQSVDSLKFDSTFLKLNISVAGYILLLSPLSHTLELYPYVYNRPIGRWLLSVAPSLCSALRQSTIVSRYMIILRLAAQLFANRLLKSSKN